MGHPEARLHSLSKRGRADGHRIVFVERPFSGPGSWQYTPLSKGAVMGLKHWIQGLRKGRRTPKHTEAPPWVFEDMERRLNSTALSLFEEYRHTLLREPPAYLVPAVWGEKKSGPLDTTQQEIHQILAPVLEEMLEEIVAGDDALKNASRTGYLLRGLFLYKMAYMVQYYMNQKGHEGVFPQGEPTRLENMDPVGRA